MILIVDDESLIRFAIRRILKGQGYDVIEAGDGLEALELVSRWRSDLVITDLRMPNLDGADLALQIHASWPGTAVILTSEYFSQKAQKVISAGLAGFIYKPIEQDVLIAKMQSAVSRFGVQKIHPATSQDTAVMAGLAASRHGTRSRNFKPRNT